MAVQVGRTVISFTIKYVQSEKEKLKSDISKVLDAKNKTVRPVKSLPPSENPAGFNNAYPPIHMQQTQYAQNAPMEDGEGGDIPDEGDNLLDNNRNQYWKIIKTLINAICIILSRY